MRTRIAVASTARQTEPENRSRSKSIADHPCSGLAIRAVPFSEIAVAENDPQPAKRPAGDSGPSLGSSDAVTLPGYARAAA